MGWQWHQLHHMQEMLLSMDIYISLTLHVVCANKNRSGRTAPEVQDPRTMIQLEFAADRVPTPPGKSWSFFLKFPGTGKS